VIFFIIFPRLFQSNRTQQLLSLIGSNFGVLAGICSIGVAFAPADIARPTHVQFVMWAFQLFPVAVFFYLPVLFMDKHYPKPYAWVFAIFCLMLVGYYLLMTYEPSFTASEGLVIQVVGQKVIAYASILSIGIQSLGAYRYLGKAISFELSAQREAQCFLCLSTTPASVPVCSPFTTTTSPLTNT
jgi:hypothetical protein